MKKRYIVAATAALLAGGMLVEMQVGSKGLDRIELAAAGGGGGLAGMLPLPAAGDMAVPPRTAGPAIAPRAAAPAVVPDEEPALLGAATDDMQALRASSSIWGEPPAINPILLPTGFADTPAPAPGALAGAEADLGGRVALAGEINRASGADALAAVLSQPLASSAVPEPATWLSLIVGLAMIGFNLRRRQGRRSVAS